MNVNKPDIFRCKPRIQCSRWIGRAVWRSLSLTCSVKSSWGAGPSSGRAESCKDPPWGKRRGTASSASRAWCCWGSRLGAGTRYWPWPASGPGWAGLSSLGRRPGSRCHQGALSGSRIATHWWTRGRCSQTRGLRGHRASCREWWRARGSWGQPGTSSAWSWCCQPGPRSLTSGTSPLPWWTSRGVWGCPGHCWSSWSSLAWGRT